MNDRMIGIIATVDQNGLYAIGDSLPWSTPLGTTHLKRDAERFNLVTKRTAPEGKVNTVIVGYDTAQALGMHPFKGRRLIVLSDRVDLQAINKERNESTKIYAARSARQAIRLASGWSDSGHIFFAGGAPGIWLDALCTGLCTCAFVTILKCDAFQLSPLQDEPFRAPDILYDETFVNMKRDEGLPVIEDRWEDSSVELEFRNYEKA